MTSIDRRFEPDPERGRVYDRVYEAYVSLHPAIAPIVRAMGHASAPNRAGVAA
jgi:hypothetical protein